ncbi:MAG: signal peptidase I [Rhodospirillales bacterium]|nr:signal peptidase I [Rhodospirillales bacterium]MBO6786794.1 signal peptidase I [Rhodospirillales bacterium]
MKETLRTVIYAVLIALSIRVAAFEPFSIPSGSMVPTLLVGDYLFVSKYAYGYSRYSLPFGLPLIPTDRILFTEPERGDVAVFKLPRDNSTDFIKRVIGLPGDRIQVKGGILHINGQAVERRKIDDHIFEAAPGQFSRITQYIETLPNGKEHLIVEERDNNPGSDNTQVYTVPDGHYFMMGDNRDNSNDSRFPGVGFVPKENFVGRAEFLFFSIDGSAWKIWTWLDKLRPSRFFTGIE